MPDPVLQDRAGGAPRRLPSLQVGWGRGARAPGGLRRARPGAPRARRPRGPAAPRGPPRTLVDSHAARVPITVDQRVLGPAPLIRTYAAASYHLLHTPMSSLRGWGGGPAGGGRGSGGEGGSGGPRASSLPPPPPPPPPLLFFASSFLLLGVLLLLLLARSVWPPPPPCSRPHAPTGPPPPPTMRPVRRARPLRAARPATRAARPPHSPGPAGEAPSGTSRAPARPAPAPRRPLTRRPPGPPARPRQPWPRASARSRPARRQPPGKVLGSGNKAWLGRELFALSLRAYFPSFFFFWWPSVVTPELSFRLPFRLGPGSPILHPLCPGLLYSSTPKKLQEVEIRGRGARTIENYVGRSPFRVWGVLFGWSLVGSVFRGPSGR